MRRDKDWSGRLVIRVIAVIGLGWGALNTFSILALLNYLSQHGNSSATRQMLGFPLLFSFLTLVGSLWLLWLKRGAAVLLSIVYWSFAVYVQLAGAPWQPVLGIAVIAALLTLATVLKWKLLRPWL
jgi:hypothetical protein